MTRTQKLAIILIALVALAAMLACNSTLCMPDENVEQWLRGVATARPCW